MRQERLFPLPLGRGLGTSLVSQEDRLLSAGWLEEKLSNSHQCPVCSAPHAAGNAQLEQLVALARELRSTTASLSRAPAILDDETAGLREELRAKEVSLGKARQKRKYLEQHSSALSAQGQRVRQIYLFVGRVQQALENVTTSRNVGELRARVSELATRISLLRSELDPRNQRDRLDAAVAAVSTRIVDYSKRLKLEHSGENVSLNIRELTLQFTPLSGRTDFLWEVGSGQNWVGYHIAGILALHEHFLRLPNNCVPRFLVVDQPSQVYFPEAWPTIDGATEKPSDERSADIEGVRRIFEALSLFLDNVGRDFQIIVTEHAGRITWEGIPNVHLVGNWRQGHDEFLIPSSWRKK